MKLPLLIGKRRPPDFDEGIHLCRNCYREFVGAIFIVCIQ